MEQMSLSLAELIARCREETGRFLRHEPTTDGFCYEIVRRAIHDADQPAWDAVFAQYHGIVVAWVRQHPAWPGTNEDADYWTNRVFERFWAAVTPERFAAFPTIAAILRYLKMCTHSVLLDDARARSHARLQPLSEQIAERAAMPDTAAHTMSAMGRAALWEAIRAELQGEAERQVAHLCLVLDLKPREVQATRPDLFPTVGDVYRVKRNVLDRLKRSAAIQDFRE